MSIEWVLKGHEGVLKEYKMSIKWTLNEYSRSIKGLWNEY